MKPIAVRVVQYHMNQNIGRRQRMTVSGWIEMGRILAVVGDPDDFGSCHVWLDGTDAQLQIDESPSDFLLRVQTEWRGGSGESVRSNPEA